MKIFFCVYFKNLLIYVKIHFQLTFIFRFWNGLYLRRSVCVVIIIAVNCTFRGWNGEKFQPNCSSPDNFKSFEYE